MAAAVLRLSRSHFRLLATLVVFISVLLLTLSLLTNQDASSPVTAAFEGLHLDVKDGAAADDWEVRRTVTTAPTTTSVARSTFKPTRAGNGSSLADGLRFTLNEPDVCSKLRPDVFTLIYVHTAPSHFKHRALIRRTYGNSNLYAKLKTVTLFFVGLSEDALLESAIRLESERYHDIVQADYLDTYRNLSLKAVSALKWIVEFCPQAPYLLKLDDDMFVNVFNLVRHLNYLTKYGGAESQDGRIHCLVWKAMNVLREKNSKWYVSPEEFADGTYPTYCSGSAFFMPAAVPPRLFDASRTAPFLWVDDAYATGVLAKAAGVEHHSINSIVVFKAEDYDQKLIQGEAVFGHMTGENGVNLRHQYWTKVLQKEEFATS